MAFGTSIEPGGSWESPGSDGKRRRGRMVALAALMAFLPGLLVSAPARATAPGGDFAPFAQCPRFTEGVELCLDVEMAGGEISLGSITARVTNPMRLQGGLKVAQPSEAESFVAPLNGETLSKASQTVAGGLAGLLDCAAITEPVERSSCEAAIENGPDEVNALIELARPPSEIGISTENLESREGIAVELPVEVHLENPLLGSDCYVGSEDEPILLKLTSGTTNPPPPNAPISGRVGMIRAKDEFDLLEISGDKVVDNSFAVPAAGGCGNPASSEIDAAIDAHLDLPSASGSNTAIMENSIKEADASAVIEATPDEPVIDATWASDVTAASANLQAQIRPEAAATEYSFEYVTETAYQANLAAGGDGFTEAASVPTHGGQLGPTRTPLVVLQALRGLSPSTAYRYRVIASNVVGQAIGPTDRLETTESSTPCAAEPSCSQASPSPACGNDSCAIESGPFAEPSLGSSPPQGSVHQVPARQRHHTKRKHTRKRHRIAHKRAHRDRHSSSSV